LTNSEKISEDMERSDRFMHVIPAKDVTPVKTEAGIQGFRWMVDPGFHRVTIPFFY
jgi:hypothetical protein